MALGRYVAALALACAGLGCQADIKAQPKPPPLVVPLFDPQAMPRPQLPTPTDLAFLDPVSHLRQPTLQIPDFPDDSDAQKAFNAYLRTLDGFPSSSSANESFGTRNFTTGKFDPAMIDPASLKAHGSMANGSVVVIMLAPTPKLLEPTDYTLALSTDGTTLTITPTKRWQSGASFAVILIGGDDPAGLKGAAGEAVVAAPTFFLARSDLPLIGKCGLGIEPGCMCPGDVAAAGDPMKICKSVTGLSDDQARQAEPLRIATNTALRMVLPFAGSRKIENVVLFWSFTITTAPMPVFDPTRGDVPFPNDVLVDPTTGRSLKIPILPTDSMATAQQKMLLDTLDGFSTSAPATVSVDLVPNEAIDPATVRTQASSAGPPTAFFLNVNPDTISVQPEFDAGPVVVNGGMTPTGQIALAPRRALLSDQNHYALVLTTDVKDLSGRNLKPPPITVLTKGTAPLFDGQHSTVPAELGDMDAANLEMLRLGLQQLSPLLQASMITPDKIAVIWTFATQSIIRPLNALDAYPTKATLTTDVSIRHIADSTELAAKASMLPFPVGNLSSMVFGTFTSRLVIDPTLGLIQFDRTVLSAKDPPSDTFVVHPPASAVDLTVPFVLTLPNVANAPVAILVHDLASWRGDMVTLANSFATAGWATLAIDLFRHGGRTACTDDAQCISSAAGACNKATGVCAGGFLVMPNDPMDPTVCSLQPIIGGTDADQAGCKPVASGAGFIDTGNLFVTRDNLRQAVVDLAQLVRVLGDTTNTSGLISQLPSAGLVDPTMLGIVGESFGGIESSLLLSVAPTPTVAVLNQTGGHIFDLFAAGAYHTLLDPFLMMNGIMRDTAAYNQLAATARWILDPSDPFSVGRRIAIAPVTSYLSGARNMAKLAIVQESGADPVVLPPFVQDVTLEVLGPAGIDVSGHSQATAVGATGPTSTFFPTGTHGTLRLPVPTPLVNQSMQTQVVGWVTSSGTTLTTP
jgi:dienelactone hydrolase